MARQRRYLDKSQEVAFTPVGQIVGRMNNTLSSRELIFEVVEDYVDSVDRLNALHQDL